MTQGTDHIANDLWRRWLDNAAERRRLNLELRAASFEAPNVEAATKLCDKQRAQIENTIHGLPPSIEKLAMAALVEFELFTFDRQSVGTTLEEKPLARTALIFARPHLTGPIAETVAELLDNEKRRMASTPLWHGYPVRRRAKAA
jgi:hypothetical protein